MIINTYPMGDQQPTPTFVRKFYELSLIHI